MDISVLCESIWILYIKSSFQPQISILLGSNDGTTWEFIHQIATPVQVPELTATITTVKRYLSFKWIITKSSSSRQTTTWVELIKLFGDIYA